MEYKRYVLSMGEIWLNEQNRGKRLEEWDSRHWKYHVPTNGPIGLNGEALASKPHKKPGHHPVWCTKIGFSPDAGFSRGNPGVPSAAGSVSEGRAEARWAREKSTGIPSNPWCRDSRRGTRRRKCSPPGILRRARGIPRSFRLSPRCR